MTLLSMTRGDSPTFLVTITNVDDDGPLDLTDLILTFTAKLRLSDADDDAVFQLTIGDGIEIVEASEGTVNVHIAPGLTEDLENPRSLFWDLQVTNEAGDDVRTPLAGRLMIARDVTRARGGGS